MFLKFIQKDGFVSEEICYSTSRPRTRCVPLRPTMICVNDLVYCPNNQ